MKVCYKCKAEKPLEAFNKNKRMKDGLQGWCRECTTAYSKGYNPTYYQENKDKWVERGKSPERAAYNKVHYQANKERMDAAHGKWVENNRERLKIWSREHYKRYIVKNRDRINRYWQTYRDNNRERVREWHRRYDRKNQERHNEHKARRRALIRGSAHQPYKRREIYERDKGTCQVCGGGPLEYYRGWHLDHIVPIIRGGSDVRDNVRVTCPPCNYSKASSYPCPTP